MSVFVCLLLVCTLVSILFAVIACDEVKSLGRQVADQGEELSKEREARAALERRVENEHRAGAHERRLNAQHRANHAFGLVEGGDGR